MQGFCESRAIGLRVDFARSRENEIVQFLVRQKPRDWHAAEHLAREALTMAEGLGRPELIGFACCQFAQALAQQGRPAEGLPYARRAVEIFTRQRQHDNLAAAQAALKECEVRD